MKEVPSSERQAIRNIFGAFKVIPFPSAPRPLNDRHVHDLMAQHGLTQCCLGVGVISGFTPSGWRMIETLARSLCAAPERARVVSIPVLSEVIKSAVMDCWDDAKAHDVTDAAIDDLWDALDSWFAEQSEARTYIVPCRIFPYHAAPIAIGPVKFYHLSALPDADDRALMHRPLADFCERHSADWYAEVTVSGREQKQATATADLIVDVALGAFQALCGAEIFNNAARLTGRTRPTHIVHCWRSVDGDMLGNLRNQTPGLGLSASTIEHHLRATGADIAAMGDRLDGFLNATSATLGLDEAWCNSAYWYHEALSENLETVAVAKMEIAIEVLLRAENSSGSKSRLVTAMKSLLNMDRNTIISSVGISAEDFAQSIVTARSRVLHGTWPTLHSHLPSAKGSHIALSLVEPLVRALLRSTANLITDFNKSESVVDDLDAFLAWSERQNRASSGLPRPS